MASKNEAKITFSAETSQFSAAIKSANASMSTLRAELKLNSTQLKGTGDQAKLLADRSKLLASQLDAQKAKTAALTSEHEAAVRIFGETSDQALKLGNQIIYSQEAEEKLAQEIEKTNAQLEEQTEGTEEAEESFADLNTSVEQQQKWLDNLNTAYEKAVSEYGETSSQAQTLKSQIDALNGSLQQNASNLQNDANAADNVEDSMNDLKESGNGLDEMFDLAESAAGDFSLSSIASVGGVITVVKELGEAILDAKDKWDSAQASISQGTGATGSNLEEMRTIANEVFQSYSFGDKTLEDVAAELAEVNTKFLYTGDQLKSSTLEMSEFAYVTNTDAVSAIDMLAENQTQWGESCMEMSDLMAALTTASQASGQSVSTLGGILADNAMQFRELGMSQEDALTALTNWTWAGNDASTYASAMSKAFQNLSGTVDDVPGTFQEAIDIIQNWDGSLADLMNATIPSTCTSIEELAAAEENAGLSMEELQAKSEASGMTIADVFGKQSQNVINGFQTTAANADALGFSLQNMTAQYADTIANSISTADNIDKLGRNAQNAALQMGTAGSELDQYTAAASEYSNEITTIGKALTNMGNAMTAANAVADGTFSGVSSGASDSANTVTESFNSITGAVEESMNSVANDTSDAMNSAAKSASDAASSIKKSMNFKANIKITTTVPKYSFSGSFDPQTGTVPTVSVRYIQYAKAKNRAYVLEGLTPFGMLGGKMAIGGEPSAGREVVTGEDYLEKTVRDNAGIDYSKLAEAIGSQFKNLKLGIAIGRRETVRALEVD